MQYDLVFEGGGAKGMVFVGALQEFERCGHTFGRLLGTSAGAIMATYTAAGFSVEEMLTALKEKDASNEPVFKQFLGRPRAFTPEEIAHSATRAALDKLDVPYLPNFLESYLDRFILGMMSTDEMVHFFSLVERGGWYSADKFMEWARAKLDQPMPDGRPRKMSNLTFAELHHETGRELSLIAADITDRRMLVLNHRTAPRLPLAWGMRMSMSVPFLWPEVIWQHEWGTYLNRSMAGHRVVDGGVLSNFPIELFLSADPYVTALVGSKSSQGVMGLLIDEDLEVNGIDSRQGNSHETDIVLSDLPPVARILDLVETTTQAHDKMVIDAFEQFVCRLPAKGYQTTEFGMSDERRERLIDAGRLAMRNYLRTRETQGMRGPDIVEMERAYNRADRIALKILK
ncbi:MAG: patatin-like phospholipase family protein [Anaerolineae bacterium]|nr:patatin-like phospholipase family protein [Anaerolineae bacterium]